MRIFNFSYVQSWTIDCTAMTTFYPYDIRNQKFLPQFLNSKWHRKYYSATQFKYERNKIVTRLPINHFDVDSRN